MSELYFEQHTLVNPTAEQRRCATQLLRREKVDGGVAWTFLFTKDVARSVIPAEPVEVWL